MEEIDYEKHKIFDLYCFSIAFVRLFWKEFCLVPKMIGFEDWY